MIIGIACDHGGWELKSKLIVALKAAHHELNDFGAFRLVPTDDYPDFIIPLALAVADGGVDRGIALCGSGVGASVVANKVKGVRAALIHDAFSARQGVEDDDMNVMCMGGNVIGAGLAIDLTKTFLAARFSGADRHCRRLGKIRAVELLSHNIPNEIE